MSGDNIRNCEFCAYRWTSRVNNPKSCPRCKRRFDYKDVKLVLRALGREFDYDLMGGLK